MAQQVTEVQFPTWLGVGFPDMESLLVRGFRLSSCH